MAWDERLGDYVYVIIIIVLAFLLNFFQMFMIGRRRRIDGVELPLMYSPDHPKFNGAQRAHQNTLENQGIFLASLIVSGFRHPKYASVFGGMWILARLVYSFGYYTGNPKMRVPGVFLTMFCAQLPLLALCIVGGGEGAGWWSFQ